VSLRDSLNDDAVSALGMLDPVALGADESVGTAVARMREASCGCAVVTEHRKPIGMFTERDVLMKVLGKGLSQGTPIADVMTANPQTIEEGCSVAGLISRMHEGGFRHMPVVDAAGRLKGVISVKRIVEYIVDYFPGTVFNLPPRPVQRQTAREGA